MIKQNLGVSCNWLYIPFSSLYINMTIICFLRVLWCSKKPEKNAKGFVTARVSEANKGCYEA